MLVHPRPSATVHLRHSGDRKPADPIEDGFYKE